MSRSVKHPAEVRNKPRKIHFVEPPAIGTMIPYYSGTLTLIDVKPRTKKDGSPGVVLFWKRSDGIVGTSGLSSNSLSYSAGGTAND
jgi:hypothetical protein